MLLFWYSNLFKTKWIHYHYQYSLRKGEKVGVRMMFVMLAPIIWPFVPYLSGLEDELRDQETHTYLYFCFSCNLPPKTIWNITVEAENRDLLMESILRLTLSLWIYLFLNKVQGHSRKVSWRMSIEQMQRCNCHPSPVLLDYTTLVHSHAWKHLIVSKLDFGSRFQKKRSSKIWTPNQLLKLCAINLSIIAMHWIILKIITISIIIVPFKVREDLL